MSRLPRPLRRLRRWLAYGLAALVICAGLVVALVSQLLPLLANHPQAVADWLGGRLDRPVVVEAVDAAWTRRGPRLELSGLRVGDGESWLDIGRATLLVDVYSGVLPGRPLTSLQLAAPQLDLERDEHGEWRLHGIARRGDGDARFDPDQLDGIGELVVQRARLRLRDPANAIDFEIPRIDARLRSGGGRIRLGIDAWRGDGAPLALALDYQRSSGRGRGWVGSRDVHVRDWRELLPNARGAAIEEGRLAGGLWFELDRGGLRRAEFELLAERVALGLPVEVGPADTLPLPVVDLAGHWRRADVGWTLIARSRRALDEGYVALHHDGEGVQADLAGWSLAPLATLAASQLGVADRSRQWLLAAAPAGQVHGLRIAWRDGRLDWIEGVLGGLAIAAVDRIPGASGLDVAFHGDHAGITLDIAGAPLIIDWPPALLRPLRPNASGRAQLYRDDEDGPWVLEFTELRLREPDHYGVDVAGSLQFDGGAPSAALRADVLPGSALAAKLFWIRHLMPPQSVAWLDEAIEHGEVVHGHAVVQGDLDDWPFSNHRGRFEAEAEVRDIRLRFRPDWPAAEGVGGRARFINDGMLVEAHRGHMLDVAATRAVARIADFGEAVLELDIEAGGHGDAVLEVLRQSPLMASHGEHFAHLRIDGLAEGRVQLSIPLDAARGEAEVRGDVTLSEADLVDPRRGLRFDAASGALRFSDRGLLARELDVRLDGQPAKFSLAIGSYASTPAHAAEASLVGRFEPSAMLRLRPALDWLEPQLAGAAHWQVELAVPAEAAGAASLRVRSDLVGTRISLPAPLAKAEAVQMPLDLAVAFAPEGDEPGRVQLQLGKLLRLHGELDGSRFDGVAAFGTVEPVERPPRGLRVVGQAGVLDLGGWLGLALASGEGEGLLADLDLSLGELDFGGRTFSDTRLRFERTGSGGARLQSDGPALAGVVDIPADAERATRGITARFDRLHWPTGRDDAAPLMLFDPASLPPLHVWIGDLRIGVAQLGEARLESFPVDSGMRIERFETRSAAFDLFARGDWTREGLRQRSAFALDFTAQDLGAMLRALGFDSFVEGGSTLARIQATWPGAPAAFALDALDGSIHARVGKGRIPDVEPGGAGRVFGLLSLTEIPRRLSLDFSDFFRAGLTFNRIEGTFVLDDGHAWTEDLVIDSPAAEIRVRGRTGLKSQDYAQTMEVLPRPGNVLPVVGALAGGPAGAAIGAVAQAVLSRPLKQMTRTLYSVEGGWREPQIDVLERGPARPADEPPSGHLPVAAGRDRELSQARGSRPLQPPTASLNGIAVP